MTPRLEAAGPEAAAVLADIHATAFDKPWGEAELARSLDGPGAYAIVAIADERVVGFVIGRAMAGEAEIITIAVRPNDRRRGLGRILMDAAIVTARAFDAHEMWLEAAVDNTAALALYLSIGFETKGRRKHYYAREDSARVDALVMRLALNTEPS